MLQGAQFPKSFFPECTLTRRKWLRLYFLSLRKWNWDCSMMFCCKSWWKDKRGEAFWQHLLLLGKISPHPTSCYAMQGEESVRLLLVPHRTWALSPWARNPKGTQCSDTGWLRAITHSPWAMAWQNSRCENSAVLGEIREHGTSLVTLTGSHFLSHLFLSPVSPWSASENLLLVQMFQCPKSYNSTRTETEILILIIWSRSSKIKVPLWMLFLQIHTHSSSLGVLPAFFSHSLCLRMDSLHWGRFSCVAAEFIKDGI